jgi:AraC-like DNA-binding protein
MATVSRKCVPPDPLRAFVKCFWYWEGTPQPHTQECLMPDAEPAIIFNLREGGIRIYDADDLTRHRTFSGAVISGARTGAFVIDAFQEDRVFGIQFHPGGTFPFFRAPASELENQTADLDCLWRGTGEELRERLLAAENIEEMFGLAQACLLAQLVRPMELHPAVRFARGEFSRQPHRVSVASVQEAIGLSQRRFIQLFHSQMGLTPKAFCRVRRFQRVLHRVHGVKEVDWTDVALESGYFDQAHFIHDFREFSGLTPRQYLARVTEHLNHVPVV